MAATTRSTSLLLAISLVWGSTWIANGLLAEPGATLYLSLLRYALCCACTALAYGGHLLLRRMRPLRADPALLRPPAGVALTPHLQACQWISKSLVLGVTMFALPDLLLVWAAQHGSVAWTPLLYAALPLGLLLVAGELRTSAILGLGAMLVLLNGSLPLSAAKLMWALPIAAAVASQGWSLVYARRHLQSAASMRGLIVQMLSAVVVLETALHIWPGMGHLALDRWKGSELAALCFLAGPATAVAYPLYYRLLGRFEPAQLAVSAWLQTLIAVAESAVLLRQQPGWQMAGAACVLSACAVLMLRHQSRQQTLSLRVTAL